MIQGAIFIYMFSMEYQLFYNLLVLDSCYSFILVSISYCFHFVLYCYIILLWFEYVKSWECLLGCLTLLFNWIWVAWYFLGIYIFKWTKWAGFFEIGICNIRFFWNWCMQNGQVSSSTCSFRPCFVFLLVFFKKKF